MTDGKDICYIKPGKDFIAFGISEVINSACDAHMHPIAWNVTLLDAGTEGRDQSLVKRAVT